MKPVIVITAKTEELRNRPQTTLPTAYAKAVEEAGGLPFIVPIVNLRENVASVAQLADGFIFSGGDDIRPRYYGEESLLPLELSPDERTDFEIALLNEVMAHQKPVLGICLGAQLINVALGGTLYQDIPAQIPHSLNHRDRHIVSIKAGTLLHWLLHPSMGENQRDKAVLALSEAKNVPPIDDRFEDNNENPLSPREEGLPQIPSPLRGEGQGEGGFSDEIPVTSAHHQAVKSPGKGLIISASSPDSVIEAIEMPDYPFCLGVQWHPERDLNNEHTKRLFRAFVGISGERSAHKPSLK